MAWLRTDPFEMWEQPRELYCLISESNQGIYNNNKTNDEHITNNRMILYNNSVVCFVHDTSDILKRLHADGSQCEERERERPNQNYTHNVPSEFLYIYMSNNNACQKVQ